MTSSFITDNLPSKKQWGKIGSKPHQGICLPLFALHSRNSCGIGEFPDLLPMIDWSASVGLDVIQLLPINDTGPGISPYSALSAFALNPIHLGLVRLPNMSICQEIKDLKKLCLQQYINYEEVLRLKKIVLKKYFEREYEAVLKTKKYQQFIKRHTWLRGYALFKSLKEHYNWFSWSSWPEKIYEIPSEINYHCFIQYLCFTQLEEVKKHAEKKGVLLKGDIPILISLESADVWMHRQFFLSDFQAGAKPDFYIPEGQNWNFPIYHWLQYFDLLLSWWKERLKIAAHFYHLYRLDHVVGLFRIWAIPQGKLPKEGLYLPKNKRLWIPHGKKILAAFLEDCDMLPIAEDLGTVPKKVRSCLRELGIPGTKVVRWERTSANIGPYKLFKKYPPISMTTVSTHDTETLQQWWSNRPEEAVEFSRLMGWKFTNLPLSLEKRREILTQSHHTGSLFHINLLQEYFPLVPNFTWPKDEDERINNPAKTEWKNWRYFFRPSVEEIVSSEILRRELLDILR